MNRFVPIAIGLAVAIVGPVSAGTILRHTTGIYLVAAGGEIRADGSIKRGSGFTARRLGIGEYEISFAPGYFGASTPCAAMTVGSAGDQSWHPFVATVTQPHCGSDFFVRLWLPSQPTTIDHRWQFTAVGEDLRQ
jgi:hypothetical protein